MSTIDFLRDIGKHVTVSQMLAKESVSSRLGAGLSYTEFSYMLLQANDYVQLFELEGCELQIGGSDQWGNIALGVDLVRRRSGRQVHGLTWPLLTKADGTKYGKTAGGETMWLGAHRLSPFRFYQGWMAADDADVRRLLLQLTLLPVAVADEVAAEHAARPELRIGQRRLAAEVTELVHGPEAARAAAAATSVLFGGDPTQADRATLDTVAAEVPTIEHRPAALRRGPRSDRRPGRVRPRLLARRRPPDGRAAGHRGQQRQAGAGREPLGGGPPARPLPAPSPGQGELPPGRRGVTRFTARRTAALDAGRWHP